MRVKIIKIIFAVLAFFFVINAFAQETSSVPSKKELYLRAREALKEALEKGNLERACEAFDYLKANVNAGAPLGLFEEYLVNMEVGRFEDGILLYADMRRSVMDPSYKLDREKRTLTEDPLNLYLYRNLNPFTQAKVDSLYARVEQSDMKPEYKELYRIFLYAELTLGKKDVVYYGESLKFHYVRDTTSAGVLLSMTEHYENTYPMSPYSFFFKEHLIPILKGIIEPLRDFNKDPFAHKYYTGGFGLHVYKWRGFLKGEATDYLNDKMGITFLADVTIRYSRVSLNGFLGFGLITEPKHNDATTNEDESFGVTLGFTVFDSRYIRVEPFIGGGLTNYSYVEDIPYDFILGNNLDFRFFATRPSRVGRGSFAFNLRFKYMMQMDSFQDERINEGKDVFAVRHTLALGLGVEFW